MAHGLFHSNKHGDVHGLGHGTLTLNRSTIIPGVSRDSSSGIYVPATAGEWTTLMSAAGLATGNPSMLHLLQEASGNPADSIGTFTLTASGTGVTYQLAVPGWTRKSIMTTAGGTALLTNTDAGLPNIATNSFMIMGYVLVTDTAANRDIASMGTSPRVLAQTTGTTGVARITCAGSTSSGTLDQGGVVRPFVLQINRTNSTCNFWSNSERVTPTFGGTVTGQSVSMGNIVAGPGTVSYLYMAGWFNAAAEMTSAQVKQMLTTLGWTGIPWT